MSTDASVAKDGDPGKVLADPHHTRGDRALVGRAVKNRWPVNPDRKPAIVQKIEDEAEKGDMRAAKILLDMEAQNQADDHLADKNERLDGGKATENLKVVQVVIE